MLSAGAVSAQEDEWYWDDASQMYYAMDEYGVVYMYEPYKNALFAFEISDSCYYYYEPAYDEFIYMSYIDDGGTSGTGYTEGEAYAEGGGGSEYDEAMNGLMMQKHMDCMNTINNAMGDFGYFYGY